MKKILIFIIAAFILVFSFIILNWRYSGNTAIYSVNKATPYCSSLYDEIEQDLKNANYCVNDSDCGVILLGSIYIEFGCYHYINVNVDQNKIFEKMNKYFPNCTRMINECREAPNATCVSNKCVSI